MSTTQSSGHSNTDTSSLPPPPEYSRYAENTPSPNGDTNTDHRGILRAIPPVTQFEVRKGFIHEYMQIKTGSEEPLLLEHKNSGPVLYRGTSTKSPIVAATKRRGLDENYCFGDPTNAPPDYWHMIRLGLGMRHCAFFIPDGTGRGRRLTWERSTEAKHGLDYNHSGFVLKELDPYSPTFTTIAVFNPKKKRRDERGSITWKSPVSSEELLAAVLCLNLVVGKIGDISVRDRPSNARRTGGGGYVVMDGSGGGHHGHYGGDGGGSSFGGGDSGGGGGGGISGGC